VVSVQKWFLTWGGAQRGWGRITVHGIKMRNGNQGKELKGKAPKLDPEKQKGEESKKIPIAID